MHATQLLVTTKPLYINGFSKEVSKSGATAAALEAGTRTIVDVLNAQTDLLSTKKNYSLAKYKYIMSGLKLKKETGSLSLVDLEQVNNLLVNQAKHHATEQTAEQQACATNNQPGSNQTLAAPSDASSSATKESK